jgi:MFS transporter, FLVCR family, MFS-domain-containing protein 7
VTVKPDNTGGIYAIMAILGVCSLTMLPVGLELGCELTRNADGSASILWFMVNLVGFVFALGSSPLPMSSAFYPSCLLPLFTVEASLRAGPDANPPLNMKRALIFNGAFVMSVGASIFLLQGKQKRKEVDEQKLEESIQRLGPAATDANV